jgi:Zn-finger nucleic acid-binding protein
VPRPREEVARVARCQACGAARKPDEGHCSYCGARFSEPAAADRTLVCPRCYLCLPGDARFCVECGIRIAPRAAGAGAPRIECPRGDGRLHAQRLGEEAGLEAFDCALCRGLWLPESVFERVVETRETRGAARQAMGVRPDAPRRVRDTRPVAYLPCCVCREPMHRRNFGHVSGIVVDTCKGHGVWLDHAELEGVLRFVEAGGLERAARIEREEARAEALRRAQTPVDHPAVEWKTEVSVNFSFPDGLTRLLTRLLGR